MPRVSVIIINHNGGKFILNCLRALDHQTFKDFEVIIVDNHSEDDSLYEIQKFLDESRMGYFSKLVPIARNLGFAGGNLEGLKKSDGSYIALLNNDVEPNKEWLVELVQAMDIYPEVGICTSKIMVQGTDLTDSAGDGFSNTLKGFKRGEGERATLYNREEYLFGACAGAALYRREMIEEIGFLDEDFFLIHEDTDLNFRAQLHGWKILYVPTAIVYHRVRSSIGHMSDMAVYYTLRNSEFVRIKNIPLGVFIRCLPEFIVGVLTEFIYFAIKHKCLKLYFQAKVDAMKMVPKMLKKRNLIMQRKKVTPKYLLGIMTSIWEKDFLVKKVKKFLHA